jgi:hypothetical protein
VKLHPVNLRCEAQHGVRIGLSVRASTSAPGGSSTTVSTCDMLTSAPPEQRIGLAVCKITVPISRPRVSSARPASAWASS